MQTDYRRRVAYVKGIVIYVISACYDPPSLHGDDTSLFADRAVKPSMIIPWYQLFPFVNNIPKLLRRLDSFALPQSTSSRARDGNSTSRQIELDDPGCGWEKFEGLHLAKILAI